MLPYNNRLTKRKDFEAVYRDGNYFSCGNIAIKAKENGLSESRLGIVVGLKFSKKAVERNKIKRLIRENLRKRLARVKKGLDIVVMARKRDKERIDVKKIGEMIDQALEKGQLIS